MSEKNETLLNGTPQFQIKNLENQLEKALHEITRLKILLDEAGVEITGSISDQEVICVLQIKKMREIAVDRDLSLEEVKAFDILHKNLRACQDKSRVKIKDAFEGYTAQELLEKAKK